MRSRITFLVGRRSGAVGASLVRTTSTLQRIIPRPFHYYCTAAVHVAGRTFSSVSQPPASTPPSSSLLLQGYSLHDPDCNVPPNIANRVGRNLHLQPNHPLRILKDKLESYFSDDDFATKVDDLSPVVSVQDNFDRLLIPPDHVSRRPSDTYYLDASTVLRCHTSAHQTELLQEGHSSFLVTGDVYRRDEIDSSHYPIFHQMEGVKVFFENDNNNNNNNNENDDDDAISLQEEEEEERRLVVEQDLKGSLEGMAQCLFGENVEMRWVDEYFPFTNPSYELEIYHQDEWLEVLGCGVMQPEILRRAGRNTDHAWAFGLGLERLAMVLFGIPDIRLFWTEDERFHKQFESGEIVSFVPYSKYPPCFKDISFWVHDEFHPNDLMEVVRTVAGDLVEQVELVDEFRHPKTERVSNCFRIAYRSMDRSLTNEEIDALQEQVRSMTRDVLRVELR